MDQDWKRIIILYGDFSDKINWKQQRLIDGGATCGYREYAKKFGEIVYLSPQKVKESWEHSITQMDDVLSFIRERPESIVWSVKTSVVKDIILSKIPNKKVYYSCNSKNRYNSVCDISLVDTQGRLKGVPNGHVWFKGKDPDYWHSSSKEKEFDYILVGTRGDKNEVYFINKLNNIIEKRKGLWVGGKKFEDKIKSNHKIFLTEFVGQSQVRDYIGKSKVGIVFTELVVEGFPQTFLEMTMCGVPVVYNISGPKNDFYFHKHNHLFTTKKDLVDSAEKLLANHNSELCREDAVNNYSLEKSYEGILQCLKL
jgi:hypothetical protein